MPVNQFYRDFEAAFRGDRAEILGRLEVYRDFLLPLATLSSSHKALDLGCGRGEWLELLGTAGFAAHGVDLDAGMLEDCFARGLSAEQGDAIVYLERQADNSQALISGFHIAEHLPFPLLQELIAQAYRVLEPAGLLILETPNPENIRVGSMTFHMDPTHNKPLPPGLLSFLARHHGFGRAQVLRLQEAAVLRRAPTASLADVFGGVSPHYAVVAQKQSNAASLALFDGAFNADRGLTLETLSQRFEAGIVRKAEFELLQAQMQEMRAEINGRLEAIQTSTSWRVTEPLRHVSRAVHAARSGAIGQQVKNLVRPLGLSAALAIHQRPRLRKAFIGAIRAVPGLEGRLRAVLAMRQRGQAGLSRRHGSSRMTPRAEAIYRQIKQLQDQ